MILLDKFLQENDLYMLTYKLKDNFICEWGLPGQVNKKEFKDYNKSVRFGLKKISILMKLQKNGRRVLE